MTDMNTSATGAPARPTFLTVLCVLSFIAAGFSIVGGALGMAAGAVVGAASDAAAASGDPAAMEGIAEAQEALDAAGTAVGGSLAMVFGVGLVLTLIGLFGVIMMWKLKKNGFYVYTGAQLLGIVAPMVMGGAFGLWGAVFSVLFIVLYGLNLKHMS